jgi:hypothetical protein
MHHHPGHLPDYCLINRLAVFEVIFAANTAHD